MSPRLVVVILLLACVSCTVPVDVRTEPAGVAMQAVSVGGTAARATGAGVWRADVPDQVAASGRVALEGRSQGGVHALGEGFIDAEKGGQVVLPVPAEIEVVVGPGEASQVLVAGKLIEPVDGVYLARLGAPKGPVIVAAASRNGMRDQTTVQPVAGERASVRLELAVVAAFEVLPAEPRFGEPVTFDASASAPSDRLESYLWDFGDGSTASGPIVTHTYEFDPVTDEYVETLPVRLAVSAGEKYADELTRDVVVRQDERALRLDVALFPVREAQHYDVGERVQFVLRPADASDGATPDKARLFFGDGEILDLPPAALAGLAPGGPRSPLIVEHAYAREGRFEPRLAFVDATTKPGDFRSAALRQDGGAVAPIVVTRPYPDTATLLDQAWASLFEQLTRHVDRAAKGLAGPEHKRVPLALTWLPDANFQDRDALALDAVERLTRRFVAAGYPLLERRAQALSRLAQEAVVDPRGDDGAADAPRLGAVDYELKTANAGERRPLVYDAALVTADRDEAAVARAAGAGQPLPSLVARFDTAEMLIAVELLDDTPRYAVDPAVAFSEPLELPLDRHRVGVALRVRLLDRHGRILDSVDLLGGAEDLAAQGMRPVDVEPGPLR